MTTLPATLARRSRDARGVAMLEFVLVLPFVWIVMALSLNVGLAYAERQRSMVAIRELALRHSAERASATPGAVASVGERVSGQLLSPRGISAAFRSAASGTCPRDPEAARPGAIREALSGFEGFLRAVSSSQSYELSANGQPMVGSLLPPPVHAVCFAVDGATWTYAETGDPGGWLASQVSGLGGRIVDAIF